jgi:hypothetical protein
MRPFRIPFFALALGIALIFAFLLAGPVFAQDEVPPAPDAAPVVAPTDAPASVIEEAAPANAPTVEPASAEVAPTEEPTAEPTQAEPLDEAPAVTEEATPPLDEPVAEAAPEIVPLDEGGGVMPLVSQEAAETMAGGDPYFKDGVIYRGWSTSGVCPAIVTICTPSINPLPAALAAYSVTATGPIYIEGSSPTPITYTLSSSLIINGTVRPELADMNGFIGTGSTQVTLNFTSGNLLVTNTIAGFTLQGMNITGNYNGNLIDFTGNTGNLTLTDLVIKNSNPNGDGLQVSNQTGNVTLNTVKSDQNGDEGARITGATGNVTIINSSFDSNGQGGC